MTREELKKAMPILTAFVEGKTIQCYDHNTGKWKDEVEQLHTADLFVWPSDFRIKPEPKYRPFRDGSECFDGMQKHEPFGWVKFKNDPKNTAFGIAEVYDNGLYLSGTFSGTQCDFIKALDKLNFMDGTPFGMKEE